LALEGGYNPEALQDSVAIVLWELTGRSAIQKEEMRHVKTRSTERIVKTIDQSKKSKDRTGEICSTGRQ